MGTAAQESRMGTFLRQLGGGPALGIFQMEPDTCFDIWDNFLFFRRDLTAAIDLVCGTSEPNLDALLGDLRYQILMTRLHYLRIPAALPHPNDLLGQAHYWDQYYNINADHGFPAEYKRNYQKYIR